MRAEVIVIDDIGLLPVAAETAKALYRVVGAASEKRSIALSSNLHPAGFDELMPKTIGKVTVDVPRDRAGTFESQIVHISGGWLASTTR